MADDTTQRASLAYRNFRDDIWNGVPPAKFTRLLPFITGRNILELGAAEGVLSLLLSRELRCDSVTGLELRPERHQESIELQRRWRHLGFKVDNATLMCGDIRDHMGLLAVADTLVCVRSIYYLRSDAPRVMAAAGLSCTRVVLCGNRGRQQQWRADPDSELGKFNYLASSEGMVTLLENAGFRIQARCDEGDPIVVGVRS